MKLTVWMSVAVVLGGCSTWTPRPPQPIASTEAMLAHHHKTIAQSVADVVQAQEELQKSLNKSEPATPPTSPERQLTRLDTAVVNVNMREAKLSSLLWIIAQEFQLNLVMDAGASSLTKVASMQLNGVTGREALNRIAAAFDVHARLGEDNVLSVSLLENRIFELELPPGRGSFSVATGGDILGSGGGKQASSLQDNLQYVGTVGDKVEDGEYLKQLLDTVLPPTDAAAIKAGAAATRYAVDRSRGLLFVSARPSQVALIERLLDQAERFNSRQLRLDVQLLDVTLSDTFRFGIDWGLLGKGVAGVFGQAAATVSSGMTSLDGNPTLAGRTITIPGGQLGPGLGGGGLLLSSDHVSAAISALHSFGNVRLLSSPTLRLKNGTQSFMSVGTTQRYVQKVTSSSTPTSAGVSTSVSVETDSVFSGVVIGVAALIRDDGRIELFLRPSQSEVEPNSLNLVEVASGAKVTLPRVEAKTMTTTLELRSGDTVIVGGLINQSTSNADAGLPGVADVGAAGLFGNTSKLSRSREMVMVIRAQRL